MKKLLFIAVIAFAFTSCTKCQDCDCSASIDPSAGTEEVCQDEFDSKDDYNEAIAALEILGCDCK
jgi:hypothetical protein|tara:strand:- start:99 stop:293 length:195 start_codon:yes stop_codon:yes gene_type:complete